MLRAFFLTAGFALSANVCALTFSDQSQTDISTGLKDALTQGAYTAVEQLGQPGGFSNNPTARIELPGEFGDAAKALRFLGYEDQVQTLEHSINSAAEDAVAEAKMLLLDSVKNISLADAQSLINGPEDAATQFLKAHSSELIRSKFLPIVQQSIEKTELLEHCNQFITQTEEFGVVNDLKSDDVELYVTEQIIDNLFEIIAQEEALIRENPSRAITLLAQQAFKL